MNKHHYFLVAGEVVFTDTEDNVNGVRLNAVVTSNSIIVPARGIAMAQQALHAQFQKRVDGAEVVVRDIAIVGLFYLGDMTEEEFNAAPEGLTMQEARAQVEAAIRDSDGTNGDNTPITVN